MAAATIAPQEMGLSLAQQAFALHGRFPQVRAILNPTLLVWTGGIQPTALSRTYTVRIAYHLANYPRVSVLEPFLKTRAGERLPHTYEDGTLCLHKLGEWKPSMLIVDSTLPWTAEWLIYYELWLVTGEWYGGGEWPPPRSVPNSDITQ